MLLDQSARLHFKILVDGIGFDGIRGGFDDQDSLGAEPGEQGAAALQDFRRSGGQKHLIRIARLPGRGGVEFRVAENHEQDEMAARQVERCFYDFRAASAVGEFCDPENEAAPALQMLEAGRRIEVIRFAGFGARLGERVHELADVSCAERGQQLLLDAAAIDEESGLIACLHDGLSESYGGSGGLVELSDGDVIGGRCTVESDASAREAAGIEDDPYLLAAFGGEFAGNELGAAGGGGPCDIADFVAALIFAQAFKFASQAAQAQAAFLQGDLAYSQQEELRSLGGALHWRVDANVLLQVRLRPALGELQRPAIAEINLAESDVTARIGGARNGEADGIAWEGSHPS